MTDTEMKRYCAIAMLIASVATPSLTQDQSAPLTAEKVREYIRVYEGELARRVQREESLTRQILEIDQDIEQRISSILKTLTSVRDSADSKTRVMFTKTKAIDALRKSIDYYVRERGKRSRDLASPYPRVAQEDAQGDVKVLNQRIDKRIEQIVELTKSFSQQEELAQYERYRDGDRDYNNKTPEARQQERGVSKAVRKKADLAKELREVISGLRRKNASLEDALRTAHTEARRNAIEEQIRQNKELIGKRQKHLEELVNASGTATKPVAGKAAFEMANLLDDIVQEIRRDTVQLQVRVSERETARAALKPLKDRLGRAKDKLAELDSVHKKDVNGE